MSGRWPSLSFVALVLAWAAAIAFLAWGATDPELEQVWRLHQELRSGRRVSLSPPEAALLERTLGAHPGLAEDWLDGARLGLLSAEEGGWLRAPGAVLLRARGAAPQPALRLDVQLAAEHLPLEVELRCGEALGRLRCERAGSHELALPAGEAALCQLEMAGPGGRPLPSPPAVRLLLSEAP